MTLYWATVTGTTLLIHYFLLHITDCVCRHTATTALKFAKHSGNAIKNMSMHTYITHFLFYNYYGWMHLLNVKLNI